MNGGEVLVRTLAEAGVEVCFANPGTSEMHTVFALDSVDRLKAVLRLAETVATGAADGYARMAGRPAARCHSLASSCCRGREDLTTWAYLPLAGWRIGASEVFAAGEQRVHLAARDGPVGDDVVEAGHERLLAPART